MSFTRNYDGTRLYSLYISGLDTSVFLAMLTRVMKHVDLKEAAKLTHDFPSMFHIFEQMVIEHNNGANS